MLSGVIVVGTGKWGRNHVSTAHSLHLLLAVVDTNAEALKDVSDKLNLSDVMLFSTLADALKQHPNAGVIITTPPVTHYPLAKEALLSNRHVLIENPFCTDLNHAAELVQIAQQNKCVFMIDHLLQYSAHHREMMALVQSGVVGDVTRIRMSRLNSGTVRLEENVLWSFSPHDISILLSLCHDKLPSRLSCVGQCVVSKGIEDHVNLVMEFDNGVSARIEASWIHSLKERRTIVYGTKGYIVLNESTPDPTAKKLRLFKWTAKRRLDGSGVAIEKSENELSEYADNTMLANGESTREKADKQPLQAVLEHFVECAKAGKTPRTDGFEALRVIKMLAAASESMAKGGLKIDMRTWTPRATEAEKKNDYFVHPSAVVDNGAVIGAGTKVWHFSHVMAGARVGEKCNIGQNVYIGGKAVLGTNVMVQNNVSICDRVEIGDDAFLEPSCVSTNVKNQRSHISRKEEYATTIVEKGASIGTNATIACGVKLERYCLVGAGAVVTKNVGPYEMVYGNPAKVQGWVSRIGAKLKKVMRLSDDTVGFKCSETGEAYAMLPVFTLRDTPLWSEVFREDEARAIVQSSEVRWFLSALKLILEATSGTVLDELDERRRLSLPRKDITIALILAVEKVIHGLINVGYRYSFSLPDVSILHKIDIRGNEFKHLLHPIRTSNTTTNNTMALENERKKRTGKHLILRRHNPDTTICATNLDIRQEWSDITIHWRGINQQIKLPFHSLYLCLILTTNKLSCAS